MKLAEYPRDKRILKPRHHIDPGFINHRLIFSTLGHQFRELYERRRTKKEDHLSKLWNNHLLVTYLLDSFNELNIKTLGQVLQTPLVGQFFCSTENLLPNDEVYDVQRTSSIVAPPFEYEKEVILKYSTSHIVADTGRSELHQGALVTVLASIRETTDTQIIAYPLVMGAPSFDHHLNQDIGIDSSQLMWQGWGWYEIFPGDIDEFEKIDEVDDPEPDEWFKVMKHLPEQDVKEKICSILNDVTKNDWGGELNDHYTNSINLSGERSTGAFLLKGPSKFSEMQPSHLGKNADQIFRLAMSPADVLVVQHCYTIGEAVRATLRAFAVNPSNPRRYCFIDGKDTYKLLKAYGKI